MCWDFTACGCGVAQGKMSFKSYFYILVSSLKGSEMAVIPTNLRMNQAYVVFYVTWTWAFLTSL